MHLAAQDSAREAERADAIHVPQITIRSTLIKAELVAPTIVELRRARRDVVRHRRGLFERAAVLEIGRDAGCPEAVVAELGCDAGRRRP